MRHAASGLLLCAAAGPVAAHADAVLVSAGLGRAWIEGCLVASALGYGLGLRRLWGAAGVGRGVSRPRALAFCAGWLALALSLLSPLDTWAERSFSLHMVQHELMMVVAAPLLCLGQPLAVWTWALSLPARRTVGRLTRHAAWAWPWALLTAPGSAWALHAIAVWGWHVPAAFDTALRHEALHALQHFSFLASALLFWWAVLRPSPRDAQGVSLALLFTTMLHTGALGALLTVAPRPWYGAYDAAAPFGLDALADQQLGGLIMWVPAGLAYLAAALALGARWFDTRASPTRRTVAASNERP